VSSSIIAGNLGGAAYAVGSQPQLSCCDIYGNPGGDWVGPISSQFGINGNISLDPLFCAPNVGDFRLQEGSPCRPHSPENPECDLLGAWPVGCDISTVQLPPLPSGSEIRVVPNPVSGPSTIFLRAGSAGIVTVGVFDLEGKLVRSLFRGDLAAGERDLSWDGLDEAGRLLPSGVYFVRMDGSRAAGSARVLYIR
jgi:hypothetical protein